MESFSTLHAVAPQRRWSPPVRAAMHPIVVIEDDDDIRETFREVLESEGYCVYTAHDGREGLRVLDHLGSKTCLVLLDLMMPVMDGWQFLKLLRKSDKLWRTPVIVVSAVAAETEGANRSMRKPIDVDDLLETVRQYC